MFDLILRGARLAGVPSAGGGAPVDIGVRGGTIAAIAPVLEATGPVEDLSGAFLCGGFVETHIHLDKSCLTARCGHAGGALADAIAAVAAAKSGFTEADVHARGRRTLEAAILHGTNRMRTHVEVDPRVGLRGFEAVKRLRRDHAWALDLQICVFPQEGLTNDPGTEDLLRRALADGADLLGGCPYTDTDPQAQIDRLFRLAREFDVDLDCHLDFDLDAGWNHLDAVVAATVANGWQGRVTVGHVTKLSMLPPARLDEAARRLADADVAVTVLPSTDLFLMGRDRDHAVPRGVAPVHRLRAHGVRCSISTNNVLNPFTPFGDCSLVRMANLYANVAQVGDAEGLAACFDMVSGMADAILGARPPIAVGAPATFVALRAEGAAQAVAEIVSPVWGMKDGRPTFRRPNAELIRP